ncbi:MAG TPA: tail fiber domain-containing protein, partial [Candidatus Paceibacterota bacterium]|nr:tail fiber domain-containing protein [Candidatus Paceibacterota bacterium]
ADGDLLTVYQNSGSFNFGTSTDLNTRLSIQSTSTNDILNLFETDGQEVFTVLENGNVGIGTSTPSELLQLVGGDIRIDDSLPSIILDSTGGDSGTLSYTGASVWNLNNTNAGTDIIRFQSDGTDRVTIDFAGNVGIGTTSPASRLDVWGGLQVGTSSTPLLFADTSTNRIGINNSAPAWGIDAVAESKVGPDADNYILITDSEYKGANFSIDPNVVSNSVGTLIKARKDYNSGGDDDYAALFRDVTVNSNGSFNEQVYGERTEFEFNNNSGTFGDVYYSAEEFVINGANNANAPNIYGQTKLFSWDEVNMGTAYGHINQLFVTNSNATTLFNNNTPMVLTNTDATVVLADSASLSVNGTSEISTLYGMRSNVAFNDTASTSNALGTISQLSTTGNSNVDQAYGSYSALSAVGTSTISQAYGLFSVITELQDGTINEAYGLYLQDINIAGSEQFGIYQEGENDRNYFGGLSAMGTTTSAARLTIQATGTDDILNLFETDGEEVFTVLENGNVGVGTTSPSTRFQVEGLVGVNRNSGGFVFLNSAGLERAGIVSNAGNELILNTNGAVEAMRINVNGNVGIGTTSANILDQANAKVLTIQSGTSGSGSRMPAILELVGSGNVISGNNTAEIVFTHGNNQNNPTKITAIREGGSFNQNSLGFEVNGSEAMRIYSDNGNLLIGTSTATDAGRLTIQSTDTSDILNLFETGGQEVFTVIENGNVGIGTSTPSEALSLAGDGYISGSLTFGNSGNVIYDNASNLRLDTANRLLFNGNLAGVRDSYLTVGGTGILAFNDAAITTGSIDAGLSRLGSGIIAVGDGSVANASGTLIAGNIGIGTTTPTHTLTVAGTVGPESDDSFNLGAVGSDWGCLYYNSGTLGTCASDERLKTDIETLTFDSSSTTALQKLAKLEMRTFAFAAAPDSQYAGLIAQEVLEVAPELVEEGSDGFLRVRYGNIQWLVLEALQELRTLVLGNRADIDALQTENEQLRERLEQIEDVLDIEIAAPSTPDT